MTESRSLASVEVEKIATNEYWYNAKQAAG
jgi:hypothetical protein